MKNILLQILLYIASKGLELEMDALYNRFKNTTKQKSAALFGVGTIVCSILSFLLFLNILKEIDKTEK